MNDKIRKTLCNRFYIRNGQFFGLYRFKNLWWHLNGECFGYGDLRTDDILRIKDELLEGEIFEGFNAHHGTNLQQRKTPVVVITKDSVSYPEYSR